MTDTTGNNLAATDTRSQSPGTGLPHNPIPLPPYRRPPAPQPVLPGQQAGSHPRPPRIGLVFNVAVNGETTTYVGLPEASRAVQQALQDAHPGFYMSVTVTGREGG